MYSPYLSCNPAHSNLTGSNPVTPVANSARRHNWCIVHRLGNRFRCCVSIRIKWGEGVLRHADVVFVEERVNSCCKLRVRRCGKLYCSVRWSQVTSHHTFVGKRCWQVLSTRQGRLSCHINGNFSSVLYCRHLSQRALAALFAILRTDDIIRITWLCPCLRTSSVLQLPLAQKP